jgi:hypothetical protein
MVVWVYIHQYSYTRTFMWVYEITRGFELTFATVLAFIRSLWCAVDKTLHLKEQPQSDLSFYYLNRPQRKKCTLKKPAKKDETKHVVRWLSKSPRKKTEQNTWSDDCQKAREKGRNETRGHRIGHGSLLYISIENVLRFCRRSSVKTFQQL